MMEPLLAISAFNDNYIWTYIDKIKKQALVVDPGDAGPVIAALEDSEIDLTTILLTHHHKDHSGGIKELKKRWNAVTVIGSANSPCHDLTQRVSEGDKISFGPSTLHVLEIPGHTLDHIAFYNNAVLFCGDTLFSAGCGKVFEGTYDQMYQSLIKLALLPDDIKIYCGHEYTLANLQFAKKVEPQNSAIEERISFANQMRKNNLPTLPSTLYLEKQMNPFLRCSIATVIDSAEKQAGKKLKSPVEVFACLREWKNNQ